MPPDKTYAMASAYEQTAITEVTCTFPTQHKATMNSNSISLRVDMVVDLSCLDSSSLTIHLPLQKTCGNEEIQNITLSRTVTEATQEEDASPRSTKAFRRYKDIATGLFSSLLLAELKRRFWPVVQELPSHIAKWFWH